METRTGKRHSTDLTDAQWAELEGFLDPPRDPSRGGRPQQYPRRRIADTVFYQLRTGVQGHLLPGDFPPWTAAWKQFCRWRDSGVWPPIMGHLLGSCREEAGQDPQPSAALLDAQSVPSGHLGPRDQVGTDAANAAEAANDTCSPTSTAGRSRSASPAISPTTRAAGGACSKPRHRSSPGLPRCSPTPPTPVWPHVRVPNSASRSTSGDVPKEPTGSSRSSRCGASSGPSPARRSGRRAPECRR